MNSSSYNNEAMQTWNFPSVDKKNMDSESLADVENSTHLETFEDDLFTSKEKEFDSHIEYIEKIGAELKKMLLDIDKNFLKMIFSLIKKSVEKIILKEISVDENILVNMIEDCLLKINQDNECIVYVCAEDYVLVEKKCSLTHIAIEIDPALGKGDFIIKNKVSELEAILEQRLNLLFGV